MCRGSKSSWGKLLDLDPLFPLLGCPQAARFSWGGSSLTTLLLSPLCVPAFSCKAGEFLDMKDQSCKPCAEGRYSLGTGIRFDEWDELPHGFASLSTNMEMEDSTTESTENCTA